MNLRRSRLTRLLLGIVLPVGIVVGLFLGWRFLWVGTGERLVVYCAHDSVYSERILRDFERETGIAVSIVFDTEDTKSLGLIERILREKDAPRCDVFWNNELLGTMDLDERGLLESYQGPGWERIAAQYKDPEGRWTGFGARMRVYIVNRERMTADRDVATPLGSGDLSRVAIAKPLYGTTLTHYCVLWEALGAEGLKAWHRDLRARGIREVSGNAAVKELVADGRCDFGFTDTDDFFVAKDAGKPVEMLPVALDDGQVISIPNTVSIIRGTSRRDAARRLVDYLLSGETELKLANSKSRQVPLGPVDETKLPEEVRVLKRHATNGFPLTKLTRARRDCLDWLKSEYLK